MSVFTCVPSLGYRTAPRHRRHVFSAAWSFFVSENGSLPENGPWNDHVPLQIVTVSTSMAKLLETHPLAKLLGAQWRVKEPVLPVDNLGSSDLHVSVWNAPQRRILRTLASGELEPLQRQHWTELGARCGLTAAGKADRVNLEGTSAERTMRPCMLWMVASQGLEPVLAGY